MLVGLPSGTVAVDVGFCRHVEADGLGLGNRRRFLLGTPRGLRVDAVEQLLADRLGTSPRVDQANGVRRTQSVLARLTADLVAEYPRLRAAVIDLRYRLLPSACNPGLLAVWTYRAVSLPTRRPAVPAIVDPSAFTGRADRQGSC